MSRDKTLLSWLASLPERQELVAPLAINGLCDRFQGEVPWAPRCGAVPKARGWRGPPLVRRRPCSFINHELAAAIHDRMPVILPREAWARWLGEEPADKDELRSMLAVFPAERMRAYPISTRVNSPKNEGAELIEAV